MTVIQQVSDDRMKIIMFFPLLLLVCSVSADQAEIAVQQSNTQDIHAVLRELAASLAVQNERITVLQRETQVQAETLESQKTELQSQKTEIDQLKLQSEEQVGKLETQKTEIDQLKQQLQVKQVAFSAALLDQGAGYTGPFNTDIILIFKHVVTNIGNAYNSHTGIFTAPVRGAYDFYWNIYGIGDIRVGAPLFRNGERIFVAQVHQPSGHVSASNGASLLLEVGDQVSVRLWVNTRIYADQNHHITFSGHLIFTM